jgi:hypothetical protein
MRSASCRETSRATKPVRLSIQHRVQRLLDRSTNHLTKMIPDPRLINLDHLSIGFSSLIGCSLILEEAVNPERSRWRASVTGKQTGEFIARPRQWQAGLAVPDRVRHQRVLSGIDRLWWNIAREQLKDKVCKAARFGPLR